MTKNHNILEAEMLSHADPSQVAGLSRFFKTGPGQYGEGDKFLGIKVPVTREVVKACWNQTDFDELEECIGSEYRWPDNLGAAHRNRAHDAIHLPWAT